MAVHFSHHLLASPSFHSHNFHSPVSLHLNSTTQMDRQCLARRSFLCLGITLTLLGCVIVAVGIALPSWQVLDLPELNAVHEHAIFYDCILSEVTPLNVLRRNCRDVSMPIQPSRRCIYKFAASFPWDYSLRMAIEEGDFAAREHLNWHRFLPQHKAVIFFTIFAEIFALLSAVVGACSSCFVPNAVLHVISIGLATTCSLLADISFFVASQRQENHRIRGAIATYQQHLGYAFFIHCLGSLTLVLAMLCSIVAAYLLLSRYWKRLRWRRRQQRANEAENKSNGRTPLEENAGSSQQEKCLLISDVLNLRQRVGTLASVDEQMPPPPPTPQLQKQLLVSISSNSKRDFRSPSVAAGTTAIGILQKSPPALWQNDANLDGSCCSAV